LRLQLRLELRRGAPAELKFGPTSDMRNLKLTIAYDGTNFVGWQRQASGVSIQGLLEDALKPIEGADVTVHGAGRTDAGVHALAQVASVRMTAAIEPATLLRALNAVLPDDVRVTAVEGAADDFHARFSAVGKIYEYRIANHAVVSPFVHRYVWHVPQRLDVDAMREASRALAGRHDFAAFQGAGSEVHSTERTIEEIGLEFLPGFDAPIVLRIAGDGFLRHMVRNVTGTLVDVGLGRRNPGDVPRILASRDRAQAGATAPAKGLFLAAVMYHRESRPA
jgi:tRNA pseudouridine38-40 synthase